LRVNLREEIRKTAAAELKTSLKAVQRRWAGLIGGGKDHSREGFTHAEPKLPPVWSRSCITHLRWRVTGGGRPWKGGKKIQRRKVTNGGDHDALASRNLSRKGNGK